MLLSGVRADFITEIFPTTPLSASFGGECNGSGIGDGLVGGQRITLYLVQCLGMCFLFDSRPRPISDFMFFASRTSKTTSLKRSD